VELIVVELDTGVELDTTECSEVAGFTDLDTGLGRWMTGGASMGGGRVAQARATPASSAGRIRPATASGSAQHIAT
jgi:hypothetical protein